MSLHGSARFADDGQLCDDEVRDFACSTPERWSDVGPLHIKVDLLQQQMKTVHEHIAKLSDETMSIKSEQTPIQVMQQRILQLETNEVQLVRQMQQMKAELQRDFQAQLTASMFSALNNLQQPSKMAPILEPQQKEMQKKEELDSSVTNSTGVMQSKAVRSSKQVQHSKKLREPEVESSSTARVGEDQDVAVVGEKSLVQSSLRLRPSQGFLHSLYVLLCLVTAVAAILALSRPGGREALRPASTTSYVYVTDVSREGERLAVAGSQEQRREPLPATAQYSAIPNGVSRCSHQEPMPSLVASGMPSAGAEALSGTMPLRQDPPLKARTSASHNTLHKVLQPAGHPSGRSRTPTASLDEGTAHNTLQQALQPAGHSSGRSKTPTASLDEGTAHNTLWQALQTAGHLSGRSMKLTASLDEGAAHNTLQQALQPAGHPSGRSKKLTASLDERTAGTRAFESPMLDYPASPSLAVLEFLQKYQGHIPVKCDTLNRKFAVEANMGGAEFKEFLVSLPGVSTFSASPLELLVGDSGLALLRPEQSMAEVYNEHRSHDGFLRIRIHGFLMPTSDVNLYLR